MKTSLRCLLGAFRKSGSEAAPLTPLDLDRLSATVRRLQDEHEAACEDRRRLLVGTVLLAHAQTQPELNEYLWALLNHFLESDEDRRLFGLEPLNPVTDRPPSRIVRF